FRAIPSKYIARAKCRRSTVSAMRRPMRQNILRTRQAGAVIGPGIAPNGLILVRWKPCKAGGACRNGRCLLVNVDRALGARAQELGRREHGAEENCAGD